MTENAIITIKLLIFFHILSDAAIGLVQSLNSTFFPPHIGAEPGRAKEQSRITCMRMLRILLILTFNYHKYARNPTMLLELP